MHEPYDRVGFDPSVFPPALRSASYLLAAGIIGVAFVVVIVSTVVA